MEDDISLKTIHACPRILSVFMAMMSSMEPKRENTACSDFFNSIHKELEFRMREERYNTIS